MKPLAKASKSYVQISGYITIQSKSQVDQEIDQDIAYDIFMLIVRVRSRGTNSDIKS